MFRVHSVSQRPNLRHLGEPLAGDEGLLGAVSFEKATEGMGRGRVADDASFQFVDIRDLGTISYC